VACSLDVFVRASQPKHVKVLEGASHSLRQSCEEVLDLTLEWLTRHLSPSFQRGTP
jgi:hypothetical protein